MTVPLSSSRLLCLLVLLGRSFAFTVLRTSASAAAATTATTATTTTSALFLSATRRAPSDNEYHSDNRVATVMAPNHQTPPRSPPTYSDKELTSALQSLLDDSSDPDYDARHMYGHNHGGPSHTLSMLQRITATRILDYRAAASSLPPISAVLEQAEEFAQAHGSILNLQHVIQSQAPAMALAAEFKRASPSKGDIAPHLNAGDQASLYTQAGANILSVLTEWHWFRGSLDDLTQARLCSSRVAEMDQSTSNASRPAVLRKEFVTSEYQIAEAAATGADTILLIVAVLPQHLLKRLIDYARSIGMEPLVEVHADEELNVAIEAGARVIGVNNRNLHTFQVDLATTQHVASQLTGRGLTFHHDDKDAQYTLCSLSGMSTALDVDRYRQSGIGMCLIGESLMRATDPVVAIKGLCLHPEDFAKEANRGGAGGAYAAGTKMVKICGITNVDDAMVACRSGANLIGVIFAEKSKRRVSAEQAREVVHAVRSFGERTTQMKVSMPRGYKPLTHMVASAHAVEDAARRPMVVGVFQNQDPGFIREMVEQCGLDMVQLHGKEGMAAANVEACGVPAIRVVDIETDSESGKAASGAVDALLASLTSDPVAILLDTSIKGDKSGGGTGLTFDWSIAQKVQDAGLPVIIAGGLTPENVKEAVATVRPWGIDVSSGVEALPGKKDVSKVQGFVRSARAAAVEASKGF